MAYSYVKHIGDGSTTSFPLSFQYLVKTHIDVYLDGVPTAYTWLNNSTVTVTPAPAAGVVVTVKRNTPLARLVDFQNATILDEALMDLDSTQLVYITQEAYDYVEDAMIEDIDGKFNAENKVIKNVADPVNPQDAMTLNYMQVTFLPYIESLKAAAEAARDAAITARNAAQTAQAAAEAAQAEAEASEAAALASQVAALASELKAQKWADEAIGVPVETGKYSAKHQADKARQWSETAENVQVETGLYSAKHWSLKASAQRVLAETARTGAELAQGAAETAQAAAEAAEDAAAISEGFALDHENKAQQWAEELEDIQVEVGKYSALHHSAKASTQRVLAETARAGAETAESNAAAHEASAWTARTGVETAEANAAASAAAAQGWEDKAQQWAEAGQNVQVEPGLYSAKHWALQAQATLTGALLYRGNWSAAGGTYPSSPSLGDFYKISVAGTISGTVYAVGDSIIYNGAGWDKIDNTEQVTSVNGQVGAVSLNYTHVGAEAAFAKNTAFNKNFAGSGAADTVARSDHNHSGVYEPAFSKGTAFNKNFGTAAGTVAEGNHNHNSTYLGISAKAADSSKLNGYTDSSAVTANTIMRRDANGYSYHNYLNMTAGDVTAVPTRIAVETSSDKWLRWQTPAQLISNLGIWTSGNDGSGSGLDADLLDGQQGSYYLPASSYSAADVKTKLLTVDGAGSGVDADLLDGQHGSYYYSAGNPPPASLPAAGAVGAVAFCANYSAGVRNPGDTVAGSGLRYASLSHGGIAVYGTAPSGTWRCMDYVINDTNNCGVFMRIA